MNSPAELLRAAFVAGGSPVAALPGPGAVWPCSVGHLPGDPDNAVCVYDSPGFLDGRIMRGGERIVHPGWQLRVRATDYTTGYGQIYDIRTLLEGIRRERVDIGAAAYRIDAVTIISDILPLGQEPEGKRRDTFTLNGIMTFTTLTP